MTKKITQKMLTRFRTSPSAHQSRLTSGEGVKAMRAGVSSQPNAWQDVCTMTPPMTATTSRMTAWPMNDTPHWAAMRPSAGMLCAMSIMTASVVTCSVVSGGSPGSRPMKTISAE